MAKSTSIEPQGTKPEQELFKDVHNHYMISKQDLEIRMTRKNGFNDADKMFASYIDPSNWPYKSMIFDPRPYTIITEKTARLIGSKPKGRLVPREGGDSLGSVVNNELLSFQWDDNSRLGESMLAKWMMMDQNVRKYGSSFGICKWRYETKVINGKRKVCYDGPDFVVINHNDVLANPSYSFINKWFQHREWTTIKELETINDAAKTAPQYKNIEILKASIKEKETSRSDRRDNDYNIQNKAIRGLTDYLGSDEVNKVFEIITEYRPDRWITFVPRHGTIIRDIPNPYKHYEIPVVQLKYYPLPDDLYGVNEYEPVSSQIRSINAFLSAFSDEQANNLYPPLMINPVNVRMHTIEFTPQAKWLMNNPGKDVVRLESGNSSVPAFNTIYQTLVGSFLSAMGESSQGISQSNPTEDAGRVTATEIKDTAYTRNVRDNMNQIFLSEALKKQIMFWHSMNQQFLFQGTEDKVKVIRIVGRDAIDFFQRQGLDEMGPTDEQAMMALEDPTGVIEQGPAYPVQMEDGNIVPKFAPDELGGGGDLYIEPGDLVGNYDYVPDIETMQAPSQEKVEQKLTAILGTITNPAVMQMLQMEGKKPKIMDLLIKMFESTNVIKDADAYFEDIPQAPMMEGGGINGIDQTGAPTAEAGISGAGANGNQVLAGGSQAQTGASSPVIAG